MRALLLLFAALLAVPAYVVLDLFGRVPVSLRDRPWPFVLVAVLLPLAALRLAPRLRAVLLVIAFGTAGVIGLASHLRYRLPPSLSSGVGAPLPDLTLPDEAGQSLKLRGLDARPTLLVWFRGSWCPFCRRQLAEISLELARFPEGAVRVLAVSPDPPEPLRTLKRELRLPFTLLSDPDRQLVNTCELAHCVAVLDSSGLVRWRVASGNWDKDLPAHALLQAAYRQK